MLKIENATLRVAGRPLLEEASVTLSRGQKAGLVGPNGTGKTSLLRLIQGEWQLDQGQIALTAGWRVGHLAQEAPSGPEPILDVVLAADRERSRLLAEAEEAADPHRLAEIHDRLQDIEADTAPARAARILSGLGFDTASQKRPVSELSGGWRMRVALASLLFSKPDLLLLDEPSNHLDLEATIWLEGYLRGYPGTLLLVSHDRTLLDGVADQIVHLNNRKLTAYAGNFATFQRTRAEQEAQRLAQSKKMEAQRKHMQAFVDRFRYKASKARQAQSRIKALEKLELQMPVAESLAESMANFSFPEPEELSPPLLSLQGVDVGYVPGKPILRGLTLRLDPDDRIALLGANGQGKTTFIRLLADELKPQAGALTKPPKLKVGYYAQDQADQLDMRETPLIVMRRQDPKLHDQKHRAHLARFGLDAQRVDTEIGRLSGGEKARLVFALVTREAPQLLLLDEPTNHLDMAAREALVDAINSYKGAVILVSHDPHLLSLVAERLWLVKDGKIANFEGDLDDYRRQVLSERSGQPGGQRKAPAERTKAETRKGKEGGNGKDARAQLRRKVGEIEATLAKLTKARGILEVRLADPNTYSNQPASVGELQSKHAEVVAAIERQEEAWLAAQEALEGGR